jgi:hypothetical protein
MRCLWMACGLWVSLAGLAIAGEPPLPPWSERLKPADLAAPARADAGESGLPAEGEPEEGADLLADFALVPPMGPVEEASVESAESSLAEAPEESARLSSGHLEAYFSAAAEERIVDPQGLLDREQAGRIGAVLENHASDSRIALQVWLLAEAQDFPADVRLEELHERRPPEEGPTVVVIAPMGKPEAARWFLSWDLAVGLSAAELRRMLQAALPFAVRERDPAAQVAELLHHLSLRLYWLESRLPGVTPAGGQGQENPIASAGPEGESAPVRVPEWLEPLLEGPLGGVTRQDLALAAGALATALAGLAFLILYERRRQWVFPEIEVEARLGGPHAAGVGAVISYASPNLPPAVQREALPDYLSRA